MLNEQERQDLESLEEIYDAIGIGQAMTDGASGYNFNNEGLREAFKQAAKAFSVIDRIYDELSNQ